MKFSTTYLSFLFFTITILAAPLSISKFEHKIGDASSGSDKSTPVGLQTRQFTDRRRFLRTPGIEEVLENAAELRKEAEAAKSNERRFLRLPSIADVLRYAEELKKEREEAAKANKERRFLRTPGVKEILEDAAELKKASEAAKETSKA
ncbi:hypothetical protein H072_8795 [Dactylellina haptotyla CBS 200.50]|uniref:Uncharacterized protein n=1 Tax=Dactylellina haptotyla (strain CBS 200.50) TaxID=1284197 RepID=S8BQG1_DACHA|nr:hypothetical protein H072_8795 [Dactylellina haptotyla CBS 200.50]